MSDTFRVRPESVHETVFIAPGAVVLGDVVIGKESSIWYHAVVRGDVEAITIGSQTNVQDGAILHADEGFPCTLGDGVTVGHNAIVHGCTIEDRVLVGMGSVVMNGAVVGSDSLIGVGAVVTEGMRIPAGSLVLGLPAKVVRSLDEQECKKIATAAEHYVENSRMYLDREQDSGGSAGS